MMCESKQRDGAKSWLTREVFLGYLIGMPRTARQSLGGMIFHVLNRGNARDRVFADFAGYTAFEKDLAETQAKAFVRIPSDCVMPNHWHLVLWLLKDGDLGCFMQKLTTTHVRRWHLHHDSVGTGHLY